MLSVWIYSLNISFTFHRFLLSLANQYKVKPIYSYWFNIAVVFDELLNAVLFGNPYETISSRAGKARNKGHHWGCILCRFLDFITQREHCANAIKEFK